MLTGESKASAGEHTAESIRAICELERLALQRRTPSERFSDFVVAQAGSVWSITLHGIWFAVWILWNIGKIPGARIFDPFPFAALTTIVSLEAIFLALFILMSQNRSSRHSDERAHLDLQINLMAERESTKMLQLLRALCIYHGLPEAADRELPQMIEQTEPAQIARELEKQLPSN